MQQAETAGTPFQGFRSTDDMTPGEIAGELETRMRAIGVTPENPHWVQPKAEAIKNSIIVYYQHYERGWRLSRADAIRYLHWLRRGNIGNHNSAGVCHWTPGPSMAQQAG